MTITQIVNEWKTTAKKKNVSSGLRSTIKWQAGKHMARQEERSKFYWWLLRYLQQPKNTYINIPDILAAQTRVRTSAEGAHTMWDTQVLELQPAAPPLSNLFLHTSIASTTFCAIHLQMSLLIAVTTTRGLLKTRQVCGACWASLSLSLCRKSLRHEKFEGLLWIYYEQEHFDICSILLFALQPENSRRLCTENLVSQHKQSHVRWVNYCWQQVLTPVAQWGNMLRVLYWDKKVVLLVTEPGAKGE